MKTVLQTRSLRVAVTVILAGGMLAACSKPQEVPSAGNTTPSASPTVTQTPTADPSPSDPVEPTPTSTPKPAEKVPEGYEDGIDVVEEQYGKELADRLVTDGDALINLVHGGGLADLTRPRSGENEEFYWRALEPYMTGSALDTLLGYVEDAEDVRESTLVLGTQRDGSVGEIDGVEYFIDDTRTDAPLILLDYASAPAVGIKDGDQAYYVRDIDVTVFLKGAKVDLSFRMMLLLVPGPDGSWIIDGWHRTNLASPEVTER